MPIEQQDVFVLNTYNEAKLNNGILAIPLTNTTGGWLGGGYTTVTVSYIQRLVYATDTATAAVRASMSNPQAWNSGAANNYFGWFFGGNASGPGSPRSYIDRITFATDTNNSVSRGKITLERASGAALGTNNDGWYVSGATAATNVTTVDRISYGNDTATAASRTPLPIGGNNFGGAGNITDGWFTGFYTNSGYSTSIIRLIYAQDTNTAGIRGNIPVNANLTASTGTQTDGWWMGGYVSGAASPNTYRINYATDTATAIQKGSLTAPRYDSSAVGDNTNYGWVVGGWKSGGSYITSTIERVTYATDTAAAIIRSNTTVEFSHVGTV